MCNIHGAWYVRFTLMEFGMFVLWLLLLKWPLFSPVKIETFENNRVTLVHTTNRSFMKWFTCELYKVHISNDAMRHHTGTDDSLCIVLLYKIIRFLHRLAL